MRTVPTLVRRKSTACSVLAMATAFVVGPSPAAAQSFQGTGTYVSNPVAGGITTGAGTTNIALNPGQTVIDWSPTDTAIGNFGAINFQPTGTTATFSSIGDFTVLNRINPADSTRAIFMDGTIRGQIGGAAAVTGGSIYFYSPSGFIMGANSLVNVGSLVLSASPLQLDGSNNFLNGTTATFGQAPNTAAKIVTVGPQGNSVGSRINANDYVAMIAPRVEHYGAITTAGQAALVGAEAATINFSPDGLFDIQVDAGTSDSQGIYVEGSITGPSGNSGNGDYNRIYMVAVPKNQALTMTIQGGADLGFAIAGAADVEGNAIVLTAGHNIVDGQVDALAAGNGAGEDWIIIGGVTVTSALTAQAQSRVHLYTPANFASTFASDVTLIGPLSAYANAEAAGATLTIDGNLTIASNVLATGNSGNGASGGQAELYAINGGAVTINGNVSISANGVAAANNAPSSAGGTGTGGTARISTTGANSVIDINGTTSLSADGRGGDSAGNGGVGGQGIGGTVSVSSGVGGTVNLNGVLIATASGYGGNATVGGAAGGLGQGGTINILSLSANSDVDIDGNVFLSASAEGGDADCEGCTGQGGNAIGGSVTVGTQAGADGSLVTIGDFESFLFIDAQGLGGNSSGGVGGTGTGGSVRLQSLGNASDVTIAALIGINADGFGGNAFAAGVNGGLGRGGLVSFISGEDNATITVTRSTTATAEGRGGDGVSEGCLTCNGNGGNGIGGEVRFSTSANAPGASLTFEGDVLGSANGFGGIGVRGGNGIGGGGTGSGTVGVYSTFAAGTSITYEGGLSLNALGIGGTGYDSGGGDGTGGRSFSGAQNAATGGTMTVIGTFRADASGQGGNSFGAGNGGIGRGGQSDNGGTAGFLDFQGDAQIVVDGTGGDSDFAVGGAGFGGQGWLEGFGTDIHVGGNYIISGRGVGGNGETGGGNGTGGTVNLAATNAASLVTVDGFATIDARGDGGSGFSGNGGNAQGGTAQLYASNNGIVSIGGNAFVQAGADGGATFGFTSAGGNATGGTARVSTFGGATSTVNVANSLFVNALGLGGAGAEGPAFQGGNGTGGNALITAATGLIDVGSSAYLAADGIGGLANGGPGGDGTGGSTYVLAQGGSILIGGNIEDVLALSATGQGADAFDGVGGDGQGGVNTIEVNGVGSITVAGSMTTDGSATGGDGAVGGNAAARITTGNEIAPDAGTVVTRGGGSIIAAGSLIMNGSATGGNGTFTEGPGGAGGSASAGELDVNAYVGVITVNGLNLTTTATGGNGGLGANGGNATGGLFDVTNGPDNIAVTGTMNFGDVSIVADAFGGNGGAGLDGAVGGNGGNGGFGSTFTQNVNQFSANAAGGTINAGTVNISLQAHGGNGGTGGSGSEGAGGNGGTGGAAQGGAVQTGSISNNGAPSSGGAFNTGDLTIDVSIVAGNGGNGGSGLTVGGNGGNGGVAGSLNLGSAFLGIRGMVGTVGDVTFYANATGGNGGFGAEGGSASGLDGNGGDANIGRFGIESRERFGVPTQRGTLNAGAIYAEAIGTGGNGAVAGTSNSFGNSSFILYNGDANIASLEFIVQADNSAPNAYDLIAVIDGTATIDGTFSFSTTNPLTLYANKANAALNQASLTATTINLTAATFVPLVANAVLGTQVDPATNPGTFFADTFNIQTDGDFYTTANLDSVNFFEIIAPGSITTGNITGDDAVYLNAQGSFIKTGNVNAFAEIDLDATTDIDTGDLTSQSYVSVTADGEINVGNVISDSVAFLSGSLGISYLTINSDSDVELQSNGLIQGGDILADGAIYGFTEGSMVLGNLEADEDVELFAEGNITTGNVISGETIDIATHYPGDIESPPIVGGFIQTGNLTAGDTIEIDAGTYADLGDLSAGIVNPSVLDGAEYNIGVLAGTYIDVGNIDSANHAGLAAPGNIGAGNVNVAGIFMVLGGADVATGSITAGQNLYFGNFSMMPLGGSLGNGGDFDPLPILAVDPAPTGGNITIGGPASAAKVQAAAGGNIDAQGITSDTSIRLEASGGIATGALTAGSSIDFRAGGDIGIDGESLAGTYFDIESYEGSIATLAVTAGDFIAINAGAGSAVTGDLSAGLVDPVAEGEFYAAVYAGDGSIETGNIEAAGDILVAASGDVSGGNMDSGNRFIALAGGDMVFGNIATPSDGQVQIGDFSMMALGGTVGEDFDVEPLFADLPTQTGGSITLGDVSTGLFQVAAGTDLTTGSVDASTIWARAGGLATLNGLWSAGSVTLISGDIAIGAEGGIDAGDEGDILIQAVSQGDAVIGDGISGTGGYRLSNAEFAKITGGTITFVHGGYGGDGDTLIGDLTITGPLAGSNIESPTGGVTFVTLSEAGDEVDGTLRIVGEIIATGFTADNYLEFATQNFELDATTGLISITGNGNALSGGLYIAADKIHVAEGSLLDQLAENPQFEGYRDALNAPAATQRPDGVIRAASIDIEFIDVGSDGPHTLYVQNTGTSDLPAGFLVTDADIGDDSEQDLPPGSVDLVINGQIVTETGTLTGVAVRDLLVAEFGTELFVPGSTINGCELTGGCNSFEEVIEQLPPATNGTPPIIAILNADPIGELVFGNEPDIDDSVPGDAADKSSPISPPQPLFDTSPLDPDSDINDPVSGAGNPSLYGVTSDEEEEEKKKKQKGNGSPAGANSNGGAQ